MRVTMEDNTLLIQNIARQNPGADGVAVEDGRRTDLMQRTLLRRWLDALLDARMRKAESVVKEHLGYFSDDVLRRAGYRRRKPG